MEPVPDTGHRLALLLATSVYRDPGLRGLRSPGQDAAALAKVLRDPQIGGFDVQVLVDAKSGKVQKTIEGFCRDRHPDDQLLIYLSCHGVLDSQGRLYYAAADTRRQLLAATAIASEWLNERLNECRARSQILVLDCCHSGAFARGAKGDTDLDLERRLAPRGRGRVVLTASRGTEYSFEGDQVSGQSVPSVFTRAIVDGLRTGDADRDNDGQISVTDLYQYVYDIVRVAEARQTPELWTYGAEGNLLVARSIRGAIVEPAPLPEYLRVILESPLLAIREAAVLELAKLLGETNPARALAARQALEKTTDEDHPRVAGLARIALGASPAVAADQVQQALDRARQALQPGRVAQEHASQQVKDEAGHEAGTQTSSTRPSDSAQALSSAGTIANTGGIFISYRREETASWAGRLYDHLTNHFSEDRVFINTDLINVSDDFRRTATDALSSCDVLLVLIGPAWSTVTDSAARRRIDNPDDFVRIEIETGLQQDIRVIPVLVEGATLPRSSDLPPSLQPLLRRQALQFSGTSFQHEAFQHEASHLVEILENEKTLGTDITRTKVVRMTPQIRPGTGRILGNVPPLSRPPPKILKPKPGPAFRNFRVPPISTPSPRRLDREAEHPTTDGPAPEKVQGAEGGVAPPANGFVDDNPE
jgi:Caspase domain/TIR domain